MSAVVQVTVPTALVYHNLGEMGWCIQSSVLRLSLFFTSSETLLGVTPCLSSNSLSLIVSLKTRYMYTIHLTVQHIFYYFTCEVLKLFYSLLLY